MSHEHQSRWRGARRALAVVGAAALALTGTLLGTTAASASPGDLPTGDGTLTIHKHAGTPGAAGDGTEITDADALAALGAGLDGVEFTIERVTYQGDPIDLSTAAGWDLIDGVEVGDVPGGDFDLQPETTATTENGGLAVVNGLDFGLYKVTETGHGDNNIISEVPPFLVTLPYPDAETGEWITNVHVYPKNKLNDSEPEKTVSAPDGFELGDTVTWTITTTVPALGFDETYESFVITDELDPRLTLQADDVVVEVGGTALTPGDDYTLSGDTVITFTASGLAELDAGETVTVTLPTTVDSLGDDGQIDNSALVNTNGSEVGTNTVQTNWGPLRVIKVSATDSDLTLAGATFELYAEDPEANADAEPIGTYETNENGQIDLSGLWVGNGDTLQRTYWLVETQAPTGYELPADTVTSVDVVANGADAPLEVTIENAQHDGPQLPLTGSTGTLALLVGGSVLVLLAIGVGAAAAWRRRQHPTL